jgi:archaellum component FlaC
MSTGDWFTLKPLNFVTGQEIERDLNDIKSRLTTLEGNVNFLIDTVGKVRQDIVGINLLLQNDTTRWQTLEGNVNFLIDTVGQVTQDIVGINLQST